jgi:DNA-binding transcriptional MerR regulator/effector-binding domain-containing protein
MKPSLSIGDFARATHLSVKTLRFYHRSGLLEPVEIDPNSGYRRYGIEQIPTAQVIRRFRALDMPLADIQAVLSAPDIDARNELIAAHLRRLEGELSRTQGAVASLRDLLEHPSATLAIGHRTIGAVRAAAIIEVVDVKDAMTWHQGALGELYASLSAQGIEPSSTAGGIFSTELFTEERGTATIFVPCETDVDPVGRIAPLAVPAVELATTVHHGPDNGIDREYGALAAYVTQHALAVDGPIREYYLVGAHETSDTPAWRTEIGWPIFATGSSPSSA